VAAEELVSGENVLFRFALMNMADGLTWKGAWAIGTAYVIDDVVVDNEIAYVSVLGGTGHQPPNLTYWDVLPAVPLDQIISIKVELVHTVSNVLTSAVSWLYRIIGDQLTTGSLVSGRQYLIVSYGAGDDFANVGADSNAEDVIFTATGATPADWSNGSVLQRVEKPANLSIADGFLEFELLSEDSVDLDDTFEVRYTLTVKDATFPSGGQTDVLCQPDVLAITPC
jgi:hypothetical protein